jgi:hypothetical protein
MIGTITKELAKLAAVALLDLARSALRIRPKVEAPPAQPWTHNDTEHVRQTIERGARAFPAEGCPGCGNEAHAHDDRERAWRRHTW